MNIINYTFHQEAAAEYVKKVEALMKLEDLTDDDKLNLRLLHYDLVVYTRGLQYKG